MKSRISTETILGGCIGVLSVVYAFFFVLIPQNWSLIDHYKWAIQWGGPQFKPLQDGLALLRDIMSVGRFRPVDVFSWVVRYRFTPITPRAFHFEQFMLAAVCLWVLFWLLKRLQLSISSCLFALVLVLGSLSMKDWLFYTSTAEPLATTLLVSSFAFYLKGKKGWAVPFFVLSILTKESFFIFAGSFVLLEIWDSRHLRRRPDFLAVAAIAFFALALIFFLRTLPQIYEGGSMLQKLESITVRRFLVALLVPPIKSYFPAFFLVVYGRWRLRKKAITVEAKRVLILGASVVLLYTFLLAAWGPFDSWFYLHIPIPFGWAMIGAALWDGEAIGGDRAMTGLLASACAYFVLTALNGCRNVTDMHQEARTVARIACEESQRVPGVQIFTNCDEGADQLRNALILYRECVRPPVFKYLGRTSISSDPKIPVLALIAKKCDPFDVNSVRADYVLPLNQWTVIQRAGESR